MSFWAHEAWDGAATPTLPGKQQVVRQGVETLLEICRSDPKSGPGMLEAKQAQEHMHRLEHIGSLLAVILGQYLHRRRSRHRQLLPKLDPLWWFSIQWEPKTIHFPGRSIGYWNSIVRFTVGFSYHSESHRATSVDLVPIIQLGCWCWTSIPAWLIGLLAAVWIASNLDVRICILGLLFAESAGHLIPLVLKTITFEVMSCAGYIDGSIDHIHIIHTYIIYIYNYINYI